MSRFLRRLGLPAAIAAAAIMAGAAFSISGLVELPLPALAAIVLLLAALPLLLRNWELSLVMFLAWLMVEDLFRKLAGNAIAVYFVKDIFYLVVIASLVLSPEIRGAWRSATVWARVPLYLLIAWALIMSIPNALVDVRIPLLGLRLDFLYVPLVAAGYLVSRDDRRLGRLMLSASVLGGAESVVGLIQAIIGPSFLAPTLPTPGLIHLILIRGFGAENPDVYRPTGTFVDPGRFDAVVVAALAVSLAAVFLLRGPRRVVAVLAAIASAAAIWVSGGRAGLLEGIAIIVAMGFLVVRANSRIGYKVLAAIVICGVLAVVTMLVLTPTLVINRLALYLVTLNPLSAQNEWSYRWDYFGGAVVHGISLGQWTGLGTGHESLGKQYLFGGVENSPAGLYTVEGGYASLAVEWGIVGLILWLGWSLTWVLAQWRRLRAAVDPRQAAAGTMLLVWVAVILFPAFVTGLQSFQNYTTNVYFWLLSGIVLGMPRRERADERLKVWVVTPELRRDGGTEYSLFEQLDRWRGRYRLRLYAMRTVDFDPAGIEVRWIPRLPGPLLLRYLWWLAGNSILRRFDADRFGAPDVIYSPGVNGLDANAIGINIVFGKHWESVRSATKADLRRIRLGARALHRILYWSVTRRLERFVYRGPALLWAVSREDAREIERRFARPAGSVPVVSHGVDTGRFSPASRAERRHAARTRLAVEGRTVCLLIANDAYKKGVDVAVAALAHLPNQVVLAVAGRTDRRQVRNWARLNRVEGRILLWPHARDVTDYYAAADMMVAPSREDAFHMPSLEAVACGLPLVLSVRAGAADLIQDGASGLLLTNPEDPRELAGLVRRVLEQPALAQSLADGGRALAERCSWSANADQAAALIDREAVTPRTLVLATDPWGVGGIQRMTRSLLKSLADLYGPERTALISVWNRPTQHTTARELHRGATPSEGGETRVTWRGRIAFLMAARRIASRWRHPRLVVIACHPHLAPVAMVAAFSAGSPYAVWCHGKEAWGRLPIFTRFAIRHATVIFAPSRFSARFVESAAGLPPGRVRVIRHGLDVDTAQRPATSLWQPLVLTVARLDPEDAYKGVDSLLCAWPQVLALFPDARLTIVGEGSDLPRLKKISSTLALDGSVRFAGRLSDSELAETYADASVFALVGRHSNGSRPEGEGFGLVFIEAAAAGLPVVAGKAAGAEEAVEDGKGGLLVEPDDPSEVAAAIVRLLSDRHLAQTMGERGRARATGAFSHAVFTRSIGSLVHSLFFPRTKR